MKMISSLLCVLSFLFVGVCNAETKTEFYDNGEKKSETNYKDGKKHGLETIFRKYGAPHRQTNYKDGKKHGLETDWWQHGQKDSETNYKDGKKHGLFTAWHENGQKKLEYNFKEGNLHGPHTTWYEGGQKGLELNFKDDMPMTASSWLADGSKCPLTNLKDGNGVLVVYHENGQKMGETNMVDGMREGLETFWHENGKVDLQIRWKNGVMVDEEGNATIVEIRTGENGTWVYEYENGKTVEFKNGKKVEFENGEKTDVIK